MGPLSGRFGAPHANDAQMADCGRLCLDCAIFRAACVTLLSHGSRWASHLCRVCAEICVARAAACDKFDMDYRRECAAACRRCAKTCRSMA